MCSNKRKAITRIVYEGNSPRFKQNSPTAANMKTFGNVSFRHQKLFWQRVVWQNHFLADFSIRKIYSKSNCSTNARRHTGIKGVQKKQVLLTVSRTYLFKEDNTELYLQQKEFKRGKQVET